jgi:hypothetical protein
MFPDWYKLPFTSRSRSGKRSHEHPLSLNIARELNARYRLDYLNTELLLDGRSGRSLLLALLISK